MSGGLVGGGLGPAVAAAQSMDGEGDDQRLGWITGFEAHRMVGTWVFRGEITEVPVLRARGVLAVRVTLRDRGYAVAYGMAEVTAADTLADEVGSVNLAALLARATELAIGRARIRQAHQAQSRRDELGGVAGVDPEGLTAAEGLSGLQVDLQIAHGMEGVAIRATRPGASLFEVWSPGYHGLRVTNPESKEVGWLWPGTALAQNLTVEGQLGRVLRDAGRGLGRFDAVQLVGLGVERFTITHVVTQHRGGGRAELVRGQTVLPLGSLTEATVSLLTQRLSRQLGRRIEGERGLPAAVYLPAANRFEDEATLEASGLAALAATRWERWRLGGERVLPSRAARDGLALAQRVGELVLAGEEAGEGFDVRAGSLALLVMVSSSEAEVRLRLRDRLMDRLSMWVEASGEGVDGRTELMALQALWRAGERTGRAVAGDLSLRTVAAIEAVLARPGLARLPWAAELVPAVEDPVERMSLRNRLDALVDELQRLQRVESVGPGPGDVIGSLALARGGARGGSGGEVPDWRSVYGLRFVSALAGVADVPDRRIDRQVFASLAARYVAYLSMTEPAAYFAPYPEGAIGGVRRSVVDHEMELEALAEALLAVVGYEMWLDRLRGEGEE
ncbi:hypothetical protein [Mucisphaera sp.]|uniref:hypothetical protein n=1 Tax=Mucisphaera sp. TaxID=2913024 RepID=UPI003D0A3920